MKSMNLVFALLFILALSLFACSPSEQGMTDDPVTQVITDRDKQDIMDVISRESDAFYARDFEAWKNAYTQDNVIWTCVEEDGLVLEAYSPDDLNTLVGGYMYEHPTPDTVTIRRENVQFLSTKPPVWVSFDEYQASKASGKVLKGVRLMDKVDGQWKIAAMHSSFVRSVDMTSGDD